MSNLLLSVVGLGANLGAPRDVLRAAVLELRALPGTGVSGAGVVRVSSLYASVPVGPPQPDYLNAAVLLRTALEPLELLDALQTIEHRHGRVRAERWGPRTLDLDILWLEGRVERSDRLVVPHPELLGRAFALVPLLELVPDARNPLDDTPLEASARLLSRSGLTRVEGPNWAEALPKL
jgi:2-amino-4-hydroxy-6-hydroxymethyldihydropteridine diphosphokinase